MTDDRDMNDREGLAAEYVIGTLPMADRAEADRLIARDPAFSMLVSEWERRLAPLNDDYAEVRAPAAVMDQVEARLFPAVAAPRRFTLSAWLGALAGLALAAVVAVVVLPPPAPPAPQVVATLTGDSQPLVVKASFDPAAGTLTASRNAGPAAEAGRDYELWIIPAGQPPMSLGLIREGVLSIDLAELPKGATLAVTLEPTGGGPGGKPSGPVLVSAVIPTA